MLPDKVASRIACPKCKAAFDRSTGELCCESCGHCYPMAASGTLPILFSPESEFADNNYAEWERKEEIGTKKKNYRARRRLPQTNVTDMDRPARERFFATVGDSGVILNLGAGKSSIHTGPQWVGLDIAPHANCEVVGDAHHLPFKDNSFDGVHTVSVFEHLRKPWLAAAEVVRVLKPGGIVFCSVPFSYPVHGSPYDFFRYTSDGLKSIFDELEDHEVVAGLGPIASITLYSERVMDAIFPGKLGFVARWCSAWTLQPLKYMDPWLTRRNPTSASSFTITACKANSPI